VAYITHIIEPAKLLLSWQASGGLDRGRHIVAELRRRGQDADLVYLEGSPEYAKAKEKGFPGEYPGFPAGRNHASVLAAFMRRLPPRHRSDFDRFLEAIRIRPGTQVSDFALLGYAGGMLPGDDFYIINPFDEAAPPFEFVLMIAGYRYYQKDVPYEALRPGMPARLEFEPNNRSDPEAVRIVIPGIAESTAGYVPRGLLPQFRRWMMTGLEVNAAVDRKNGMSDRPLVYLFVEVRSPAPDRAVGELAVTAAE
jgi:hypothetical protein